MTRYWTADSDWDWYNDCNRGAWPEQRTTGQYDDRAWPGPEPEEEEPEMDDVAVAVLARLNTAIMALKAAMEVFESPPPLADRRLLNFVYDALAYATSAETECKRRLKL